MLKLLSQMSVFDHFVGLALKGLTFSKFNPFQSSITIHIETIHLISTTNKNSGFYMECTDGLKYIKYDCHIFSKYLVFQMKNLVFQSKNLVFQSKYLLFRSKTLNFDRSTRHFE